MASSSPSRKSKSFFWPELNFAAALSEPDLRRDRLAQELEGEVLAIDRHKSYFGQADLATLWLLTALPLNLVDAVLLSALDPVTVEVARLARSDHPDLWDTIQQLELATPEMHNSALYVWPGTARAVDDLVDVDKPG
ncbi:uncharacterized protein JCM15063_006079 [Sporobolomyces koalae]|uniref:uncharacterized protein n=1 Tax=Sporobolomyces koalae TaxID=500713 RepID=UPI00317ADC21